MLKTLRDAVTNLGAQTDDFGLDTLRNSFEDVDEALESVESVLGSLRSWDAPLAADVANHLVTAGGKRLRPALLFLTYGAAGGTDLTLAKPYAAASELIHTATLLHDDVIDEDLERRGVPTANELYGTVNAVLSGDYLVAHVINELLKLDEPRPVQYLSKVMTRLTQGEILQDEYAYDPGMTEDQYLQIARLKTSSLFSYAAWCGAYIPNKDEALADDFGSFAEHLGIAFQMVDDVLDYYEEGTGKTTFSDLENGQVNYPLIVALKSNPDLRDELEALEEDRGLTEETKIRLRDAIEETDALSKTREEAREFASRARACIDDVPSNQYTEALGTVTEFVFRRFS